jgi:hypothetical protein
LGALAKNGISLEGIIIFLEKILAKTPNPELLRSIQGRNTSQKFGIWGFCQNFLQKYYDSLNRDSIFWRGSTTVLGDYR